MSTRDGNSEIYVVNRDGSNVRRLTNNPAIDIDANLVADRHADRLHVGPHGRAADLRRGADGLGSVQQLTHESYADRPTWSPAPYNEIAYAARNGPGFDIKVIDVATRQMRQLTFGEGTNESPAFVAERPAPRVHVDARRARRRSSRSPRRQEPEADHQDRQQLRSPTGPNKVESRDDVRALRRSDHARALIAVRDRVAVAAAACGGKKPPVARPCRRRRRPAADRRRRPAAADAASAGRRAASCRPSRCATTRLRRRRSTI